MSTDRVTSPEWSPLSPWTTHAVGTVYRDDKGGPALERVVKLCRDARGNDRLRGCGKRFEGWVIAAEPLPVKVRGWLPLRMKRQIQEDGVIWGICDDCIDRMERNRPERQVAVQVTAPPRRASRTGREYE